MYFGLFTLCQKKTNSNCCTAALAVYLLLFNASYYLHSPSTASRARYRRSACIDMDMLRLAAAACRVAIWTEFQHSVVYCDWYVSKKTGSVYPCKRLSLGTLALTLLAWHSSCHLPHITTGFFSDPLMPTHNWLFLEPPTFAFYKVVWWHWQVDYSLFSSEIK